MIKSLFLHFEKEKRQSYFHRNCWIIWFYSPI